MATTISVNGQDGSTLARSSGIRLVQEDNQALVLRGTELATRNGRPGHNAPQAIRGGPAGTMVIQLFESELSQGAIRANVVDYRSAHRPPPTTEVPIGRDLVLTTIGGNGEAGHQGGHGQEGLAGANGTNATTRTDATNGTDGGRGGDAGQGSNGADGGEGGTLHVVVNENSTHLLMAVSFDVRGGKGGNAGVHGNAGIGGAGGIGGQGWKWKELVGYKFHCTNSCIKTNPQASSSPSTAFVRTSQQMGSVAQALMHPRTHAVSGGNLTAITAQLASRYGAIRHQIRDPGACRCGGGTGNCLGCEVRPIHLTLTRAPGLNGKNGENGRSLTTPLAAGSPALSGTVTLVVQRADGTTQEYPASWQLELLDFEFEDENQDGVCEPGECLFIRRLTIRNSGT